MKFLRSFFETKIPDLSINHYPCVTDSSLYISSESQGPNILWTKGKVALSKGKTLPILELLSVFLALTYLPQGHSSFQSTKFRRIRIFSDFQITLAWLKYEEKEQEYFFRNRIQDIFQVTNSLKKISFFVVNISLRQIGGKSC